MPISIEDDNCKSNANQNEYQLNHLFDSKQKYKHRFSKKGEKNLLNQQYSFDEDSHLNEQSDDSFIENINDDMEENVENVEAIDSTLSNSSNLIKKNDFNNNNNNHAAKMARFKSRTMFSRFSETRHNNIVHPKSAEHPLNVSSRSLSELDNIKKRTLNNLKNYRLKFQTLRSKIKINKYKKRERLIRKNGESNIIRVNIESRGRKYIADLFNTLIDLRWGYILILFNLSFLISWLLFGILWFILQTYQSECVSNLGEKNFIATLYFSIETQQTIGYGSRFISNDCHSALIILTVQCLFSVLLQSFMGGIVFAKLSRPKKRTETLIFSKHAVLSSRDGAYCFMCRIGDMRKSHIIQAYIKMYLVQARCTKEGELIPWNAQELKVDNLNGTDRLLFMPIIAEHKIDETSPLWNLIRKAPASSLSEFSCDLSPGHTNKEVPFCFKHEDFEIIVVLEGTVESTGATTQARTSYLPSEILWSHVFEPLVDPNVNKAMIDYSKFHKTVSLQELNNRKQFEERKIEIPTKLLNTSLPPIHSANQSALLNVPQVHINRDKPEAISTINVCHSNETVANSDNESKKKRRILKRQYSQHENNKGEYSMEMNSTQQSIKNEKLTHSHYL